MGGYLFDGVDDYFSGLPELPDEYTITAVTSAYSTGAVFPEFVNHNDTTLLDDLTTAGGFEGFLHNLAIWDWELTSLQLEHARYEHLRDVYRGVARGFVARLIAEGVCVFYESLQASPGFAFREHAQDVIGTPDDVTLDPPNGATFGDSDSHVLFADQSAYRLSQGTILASADTFESDGGTLLQKGANYSIQTVDFGANVRFYLNSSYADFLDIGPVSVAVTMRDGEIPRIFADGEYQGDGDSSVTLDDTDTDDLIIGNSSSLNNRFLHALRQVCFCDQILTDTEIMALHNNMAGPTTY